MSAPNGLTEGQRITIPAGVMKSHHNSTTFKPFDPSETLGDISPTTPTPQKTAKRGNKCGIFGVILLVAIAVAVTVVTSGAFLAATGAVSGGIGGGIATTLGLAGAATASTGAMIAAGAVGGVVGSIVSQGVGVATGIQDKFSWKQVAMAGLSGGIGAGVGKMLPAAQGIWQAAARGAAVGATTGFLTQSIAVMTGLQSKFDFAGVAAAAVGGAASGAVGAGLNGMNRHLAGAIASSASAIANAATRSLIQGTSFGDNLLAALPDVIGSTLGNMLAEGVAGGGSGRGMAVELEEPDYPGADSYDGDGIFESWEGTPPDFMPAAPASWFGASGEDIQLASAGGLEGLLAAQATAQAPPRVERLPGGRIRIGNVIYTAVQVLEMIRDNAERSQVNRVIERFGLNSADATDVMAARAYVWGTYNLPAIVENVGWSGPTNDAASQGLMRVTMVDPAIFVRALYGSNPDQRLLYTVAAGNAANAERSRARPQGVEPALQTTSRAARAALAEQLSDPGRWQVHHLVPAEVWGAFAMLARRAQEQGWNQDSVLNLIALPADAATQRSTNLPIHNGSHPRYNAAVSAQVRRYVTALGGRYNAYQARGILDLVAAQQRMAIVGGTWNPRVN
jgi:hypothetical protein